MALQSAAIGATSLALGAQSAWAQEEVVFAQSAADILVQGQRQEVQSPKYTAPLLDTPQTITVVPREVIEQQNLLNLRDILSTLPGITFGAGEGGGGYGDSINLRGYSANNDIGVDGVRDSAQYSRTDPFNLEQVEVTNGANSVYGGAGSVGGTVNLVSKRAQGTDRTTLAGALGTDAYQRATIDSDMLLSEGVGLRVNAMFHQNDVPGRDVEHMERWGFAPSLVVGLGSPTQVTLSYFHQQDNNTPQYGVPFAINAFNDGIVDGADPERYYGWSNLDRQDITADLGTLVIDHTFNENLSLRNLTRGQQISQDSVISNLGGTYCTDAGINPFTGAACASPGTRTPGANGHTNFRFTENDMLYNQTDFTWKFATGGWEHTLVTGLSLAHEDYTLDNGSPLYNPDGTRPPMPGVDLSDPDHIWTGPVNVIRTAHTDADLENYALYAFDAIELNDQWELNGGVRVERQETTATITSFDPEGIDPPETVVGKAEHDLFSYRFGVVYKPVPNASIYFAYGNSESPPQTSVVVRSVCAPDAASCSSDPEEAETTELGVKWDVFDSRLSLTAAIFRNERNAFYVASDIVGEQDRLDGQSRVDGIALGASGLITDNWSVFANYTFLDSELLQDVADALVGTSFRSGDPLPNTPEHAFSIWTTYEPAPGFLLGYGATYQGEYTFSRPATGAPLAYTDDYWVHRAMVSYAINDNAVLRLNVNNLLDEEYYERIRNNSGNGWATPGAARSAVLELGYRF